MDEIELPLSDDDEEAMTAQQLLEKLQNAWLNERAAPEILPHRNELVDAMLEQISHIEENSKKLDKNSFRAITHRMELERLRFIIASYLRCRLQKIETYCSSIILEEEKRSFADKRLSENETTFCKDYHEGLEKHLYQIAIQYMPENLRSDNKNERVIKPNLMSHVFFKANESIPAIVIDGPGTEDFNITPGSQHIMPYRYIADLIRSGKVQLF